MGFTPTEVIKIYTFNRILKILFAYFLNKIKKSILRIKGAQIDPTVKLHHNTIIKGELSKLHIGRNVNIGSNNIIVVSSKFKICSGTNIGNDTLIRYPHSEFKYFEPVTIGNNVTIGSYVLLDTSGGLTIGNDTIICREVKIYTHKHNMKKDKVIRLQNAIPQKGTIVGRDVFVGVRSIILGNVTIGDGAIIGANSVVTKNVKPYSIVGGVPARKIGMRK